MKLKTALFLIFFGVLGMVMTSFFAGNILMSSVVAPFGSIKQTQTNSDGVTINTFSEVETVQFADADLESQWIPWVIKQASILIGGLSLIIFVYAGIQLIIHGDQEEQFKTSVKMLLFGVIGIALAAFAYTIIDNLLNLFL